MGKLAVRIVVIGIEDHEILAVKKPQTKFNVSSSGSNEIAGTRTEANTTGNK
jgi:hypothetical protein